MNRFAANNPEDWEEKLDTMTDHADLEPLRPCAACGEPTRGHWCSDSCRRAEDGPQPDEIPEDDDE